jgi:endonuclease YncB( thermonuclease family)
VDYLIEIFDTWGRRIAWFDDVPLLEVTRRTSDQPDTVRGMLPTRLAELSHGYRVRVTLDGALFCDAAVTEVAPHWSDTRKLIVDRYVGFHEVMAFAAERPARDGNETVVRAYQNRDVAGIVKDAINSAPGHVHYTVDHTAYPDGAEREYQKFQARKTAANELEVGGIDAGQWVGSERMDLTGAYAQDGDTIAGIEVDGADWPDLRLMLIDTEETSRNSHAISRHPEVADWTDAQYAASGYKFAADAATDFLQNLIDTEGIDYIELNPHKDASGNFDDRVDAYGRYLGLVYGGGECFNAALVEGGHTEVYLYDDGRFLVPELELKEFFSYDGVHIDSVAATTATLVNLDVKAGVFEILAALAYAAEGFVFSVDAHGAVTFREALRPDHVWFHDPLALGAELGSASAGLVNILYFDGNPVTSLANKTYTRGASIDEYGAFARHFDYFAISLEEDADRLAEGLLHDVAYPTPSGAITFYRGNSAVRIGDIVELRDGPLRRLERETDGEWDDRFTDALATRVKSVSHHITGRDVRTNVELSSPLRSVDNPLGFLVRSQPSAATLFQFRLDDPGVGLDVGYHLD